MRNRFIYFIARRLTNYPKGQKYGLKLFHWFMPYGEDAGYQIRYMRYRDNSNDIS